MALRVRLRQQPTRLLFVLAFLASLYYIDPLGLTRSSCPEDCHASGRLSGVVTKTTTTTKTVVNSFRTALEDVGRTPRDAFGFQIRSSKDQPPPEEFVGNRILPKQHIYRGDGLLEVNPNGAHPIFDLMSKAQEKWKRKNERASKSLKQACAEYKRRHGRKPPRGFHIWWTYVQNYQIPLPDEYDQIYKDIEPFWGMDPRRLKQIQREWEGEANTDTFTVGKHEVDDPVMLLNYTFDESKKDEFTLGLPKLNELLKEVNEFIPPFRAIFSPHDGPNLHTDYELMTMAVRAAREGKYIDVDNPPEPKLDGWISSCPPDSPAWTSRVDYTNPAPPLAEVIQYKHNTSYATARPEGTVAPKTFIYDHKRTMDPCLHPSHLLTHGQFLSHEKGPIPHRKMYPQFSLSPTLVHHDIHVAMPHSWVPDIFPRAHDPEFELKDDPRLEWRGSTTGMWHGANAQWWLSQRARLLDWANPRPVQPSVVETVLRSPPDARWKVGEPITLGRNGPGASKAAWAPAMADIAYVGKPHSCSPDVCEGRLKEEYDFRPSHNIPTQGRYKYIMDVDGNAWSSRFKRLITSNSLIFKSTIYPEWFTDRIEPWLHYVPIQVDYSDLLDVLYFFRGDPSGHGAHHELAKTIAESGRQWSLTHWREVDHAAYMFRLFLEYSRVMSVEREDGGMDYEYDESDEYDFDDLEADEVDLDEGW